MNYKKIITEIQKIKDREKRMRMVNHEQWVILNDIEFMLNEFKNERKLKLLQNKYNDIYKLLIAIENQDLLRYAWQYGPYFRMKIDYLRMKEVYENKP